MKLRKYSTKTIMYGDTEVTCMFLFISCARVTKSRTRLNYENS